MLSNMFFLGLCKLPIKMNSVLASFILLIILGNFLFFFVFVLHGFFVIERVDYGVVIHISRLDIFLDSIDDFH